MSGSKRVFLTGATGFLGRAVVLRLLRDGHRVTAVSRDREGAISRLGPDVRVVDWGDHPEDLAPALSGCDTVLHLAGESIAGLWTRDRKRRIRDSRVQGTRWLVEAMRIAERTPPVLVSASAVGWYGDRRAPVDEFSEPGAGFLANVCDAWEHEAARGRELGARVAIVRLGVVLGREGGALAALLPAAALGLAGRLGRGDQPVPWIHLHDAAELFVTAATDDRYEGTFCGVARSDDQRTFARAIARAAGRRGGLPAPAWAVRAGLGEAASMLLEGAPVRSRRLPELGYAFHYGELDAALAQVVDPDRSPCVKRAADGTPDVPDGARYVLEQRTRLEAPPEEAFAFFSKAHNLALLTPSWTDFRILGAPGMETEEGTRISYRLRLGPVPLRWRTRIARWEPGRGFVDTQERGPYTLWWHEHEFVARDGGVDMIDRVHYTPPLGWLGDLANRLFVARTLKRIFAWRAEAIALRFGPAVSAAT